MPVIADALSLQLEAARENPRAARYIVTAVVGVDEYDVGETVIGPETDVEATRDALIHDCAERLRRLALTDGQIAGAADVAVANQAHCARATSTAIM